MFELSLRWGELSLNKEHYRALRPFVGGLETHWPLPFVTSPLSGAIFFSISRLPGLTLSVFAVAVSDFFAEQSDKSISR